MNAMPIGGISSELENNARSLVPGLEKRRDPGHPKARETRIAIVGFGTVGSAVARLLSARHDDHGLRIAHVCNRNVARKRVNWMSDAVVWSDDIHHALASDAEVVVELMGGLDPARELVAAALRAGKSVVTANKQLMALHGPELLRLAREHGQYLGFGACVAGGVPVLSALQDGLAGDRLVSLHGILNGTCNYILSRIEQAGATFADGLCEAQQAGYAEADPTDDVDGLDAAAKLVILARVGLKIEVRASNVLCRSIRDVAAIDFEHAHDLGCTIRQISIAKLGEKHPGLETARPFDKLRAGSGAPGAGPVYLAVQPALVPNDSPFAKISGSQNLVVSTGEFGGDTTFSGFGAGGDPTAVAVVSDLFQAASHRHNNHAFAGHHAAAPCELTRDLLAPRYLRFVVKDQPGIIARISARLAKCDMNIDCVFQKPGHAKSALPFVITLEPCAQSQIDAAMAEINHFDFLVEKPLCMPMLGENRFTTEARRPQSF